MQCIYYNSDFFDIIEKFYDKVIKRTKKYDNTFSRAVDKSDNYLH